MVTGLRDIGLGGKPAIRVKDATAMITQVCDICHVKTLIYYHYTGYPQITWYSRL